MRLIVIGHARHGKDTVCEILRDEHGFSFVSSSRIACRVVYPQLKYESEEECFQDRANHRKEWYQTIASYNAHDKAALGRIIFQESDIYCGLRDKEQLEAILDANLADYVIWVDRSKYVDKESEDSMNLSPWDADILLSNNGTLEELRENIRKMLDYVGV